MVRSNIFRSSFMALALGVTLGAGCDVGIQAVGGNGNGDGGSGGDGGGNVVGDGLPCDVYKVLQTYCLSCHGSTPSGGAPNSLTTYAQLTAPSIVDANMNYAQRSLARINNANSPMPPKPASAMSAADLKIFQDWVNAGTPKGMCGNSDGGTPDPLNADPTCTSKSTYTRGNNINMEPGGPCIQCHMQRGEGQMFQFAGTLFPTGHEPDRCNGGLNTFSVADAKVIITDANGVDHTLAVHSPSGNFGYGGAIGQPALKTPYTAKVVYKGIERVMVAPQTEGDCNVCHTQAGDQNAPGRITIPVVP